MFGEYGIALIKTNEIIVSVSFYIYPNLLPPFRKLLRNLSHSREELLWHDYDFKAMKHFVANLFNEMHVDITELLQRSN
jgi:hypothetical protein